MTNLSNFIKTTLVGGFVVILPITILLAVLKWAYSIITGWVQPMTTYFTTNSSMGETFGDLLAISIILAFSFAVGYTAQKPLGRWLFAAIEQSLFGKLPGYNLIKETTLQFLGNKKSPFSTVALARIFGNETRVTAFVTESHADGSYTVFVPTGPNPTSGNIYHLKAEFVQILDADIQDTMRSIISCGAGSEKLLSLSNNA
jgi:uncharacterized membrane protein